MSDRPKHLLFDCDPGCDDAVAIAFVLGTQVYKRIDFLTVAGNVSVDQTTENTRRILSACGVLKKSKIPECHIYRGCSRSMMSDEPSAASVHGRDGLGDAPNSLITGEDGKPLQIDAWPEVDPLSAVERLLQVSRENEVESFDLLCTGPLTNLATALSLMRPKERDSFFNRTKAFVVMGGAFNSLGNITHSAEFNLFADPAAAQIVLSILKQRQDLLRILKQERDLLSILKQQQEPAKQEWACPSVHFVPLDATEEVGIPLPLPQEQSGGKRGQQTGQKTQALGFLRYALNQYGQFHVFSGAKRPDEGSTRIKPFEAKEYIAEMLSGGSGTKALKPFCYLHDGLAAWVLVKGLADTAEGIESWNSAEIRIDANRGESRGRVIVCPKHKENGPVNFPSLGTAVKWFQWDPKNDQKKDQFLEEIGELLALK